MPGASEIREAISALEARRVELEALIAADLEQRFFSRPERTREVVTNPTRDPAPEWSNSSLVATKCDGYFTMTWLETGGS